MLKSNNFSKLSLISLSHSKKFVFFCTYQQFFNYDPEYSDAMSILIIYWTEEY